MTEMYKILSGKYDTALIPQVNRDYSFIIIRNNLRLKKNRVMYDLCKHYFTNTQHRCNGRVFKGAWETTNSQRSAEQLCDEQSEKINTCLKMYVGKGSDAGS